MILVSIIIFIVLLDQVTKYLARYHHFKKNTKKIKYISYLENTGGATGVMDGQMWLFYIITIIVFIIAVFASKYIDFENNIIYSIGLGVALGGTIGNFIDRVVNGAVIDFLEFKHKKGILVYNIADVAITVGFILIIIGLIRW